MMSAALASSGVTRPPAASTSGSASTLATSAAGIVTCPLVESLTISLVEMTASVLSYVAANSPLKDCCIVSVRM